MFWGATQKECSTVRTFLFMGFPCAGLTVNVKLVDTEGWLCRGHFISGTWASMNFDIHKYQIPGATPCSYQGMTVFLCFPLSVFKQKYDSHGIGVNLLKCLDHLLITIVLGDLWSSEWVLELLVLTAFSWGLLEWASLEPRTYLQLVFLFCQSCSFCRALHSPGPPKWGVSRPLLNFLTHGVFLLFHRVTVDFPSPGPLHMLSSLFGILFPWLVSWIFAWTN